jgi:hypothetical protein
LTTVMNRFDFLTSNSYSKRQKTEELLKMSK